MMSSDNLDEPKRRYWREQTEAAYQWMMAVREYPVQECGEKPVRLDGAVRRAPNRPNVVFSTTRLAGMFDRQFYLREGLIDSFLSVARRMNDRGWILKVEDGYRSREMQKQQARAAGIFDRILQKVIWECGGATPSEELLLRRITVLVVTMPKIGTHMSASAIDISVLQADGKTEVDRGGPYLEMSELTPMDSPFVSSEGLKNRREITAIMAEHGFVAYPYEFWHYSRGDAYDEILHHTGRPARYGPIEWDPATQTLRPYDNPTELLNSIEDIREMMAKALKR
jgi:D-alanyl-D-alanine dipeptidase